MIGKLIAILTLLNKLQNNPQFKQNLNFRQQMFFVNSVV